MFTSLYRIESNRRNALQSTGPRTGEGKARVRLNAARHGYCSGDAVLPGENAGAYHVFAREIRECYNPRTAMQKLLLEQIISLEWRLRRIMEAQVKVFEYEVARCEPATDGSDRELLPCEVLAERFSAAPDNAFVLLNRYERSVRGSLLRTMQEYDRLTRLHPVATHLDSDSSSQEPIVDDLPDRLASAAPPPASPANSIEKPDFPATSDSSVLTEQTQS